MKLTDDTTSGGHLINRLLYLGLGILILGPRSGLPGSEWSSEIGFLLMVVALSILLVEQIRRPQR